MKVLFVLFQKFDMIPDGGDLCNKRNLEMVKSICGDSNVDLYYIRTKIEKSFKETILFLLYMSSGYYRGLSPRRVKDLCNKAVEYDCVFLSSSLFGVVAYKLKENGYKGKIILQFHNVESIYYSCVLPKCLPFRKRIIKCIADNELMAGRYSDIKLALNDRDRDGIVNMTNCPVDYVIPITLSDKAGDNKCDEMTEVPPLVSFIGSNFLPNAEGVLWFVRNVLPFVNIRFIIVGKNMGELKKNNDILTNINVLSDVPDLGLYFKEADVIIAPIFSGSGMKVKTCESLMYGKNILGTSEAFEGYDIDFDKVGKLANTAKDYIEYLNALNETPIPKYNNYSRMVYLDKYSDNAAKRVFEVMLNAEVTS